MLSRVLRGERKFSSLQVQKLSAILNLDSAAAGRLSLLSTEGCDNAISAQKDLLHLSIQIESEKVVETENFNILKKWYQVAILEMISIPKIEHTPSEFSKRLGIAQNDIEVGLGELIRHGYLRYLTDTKRFEKTAPYLQFGTVSSPDELRTYYRQMLRLADSSLKPESVNQRHFATETFAFSDAGLPEARKCIERCLKELVLIATQSRDPNTVYHVGIQLFELLKKEA